MKINVLARRYAMAFIETIDDKAKLVAVKKDFDKINLIIDGVPQFLNIIQHPLIKVKEKKSIITELSEHCYFTDLFKSFLLFLVEKERIKYISSIKTQFILLYKSKMKEEEIEITSAFNLSNKEIRKIEDVFSKLTGNKITSSCNVDDSLIGGLKVKIANTVYDGSIKNKLNEIKDMF